MLPATRDWTWEKDIAGPSENLEWVQGYCERGGSAPCDGISERAVKLCLERRDCHPAVLVAFESGVQAFFSGGWFDPSVMTIVSVWRGPSQTLPSPYGTSRQLLEAFLSKMDVWVDPSPGRSN